MIKTPYYQEVAEKIVEQLKQGQAPWMKPWDASKNSMLPYNPITNKRYRGINAILLMAKGDSDNRWMTYNQASSLGAQVRKGEKSTKVQYWKFHEEQSALDENGKPKLDKDGNELKVKVALERPKVFYASVFHASQIDNLPEMPKQEISWDPNGKAENLLKQSGAVINHKEIDRAFYRPSTDSIHLPPKEAFKSEAHYYATALHELGHWTGHESRLNRDLNNPFGSEAYGKEELKAEISSMILGMELGIGHDPSQHTSYIQSWIKVLENNPLEIFRATADAEKIVAHIKGFEQEQTLEVTNDIEIRDENRQEEKSMVIKTEIKKVWLTIPFHQKDTVKALAGELDNGEKAIGWDKAAKMWYAKEGADLEVLKPWVKGDDELEQSESKETLQEKTWLLIPYEQKNTARSIVGKLPDGTSGISWDKEKKCWFAKPGVEKDKIKSWLPSTVKAQQTPAISPVEEFKEVLLSLGASFISGHPIMDGKPHRIATEGDKRGETAMFYVGHMDGGIPAGYIKNHRTGAELKWQSKGYVLSKEEKQFFQTVASEAKAAREKEIIEQQENVAQRIQKRLTYLEPVNEPTSYLKSKGVKHHLGIYYDVKNNITCIPATDIDGKVWNMQYVSDDGIKRFAKYSKKEGCFHALDGLETLNKAPVIIIAEGYSTAATIKEETNSQAVISAFDSGNLLPVAKAIRDKYPDTPIIIAGDDDLAVQQTQNVNPGKKKAMEAAEAVNGTFVLPIFAPNEQSANPKKFTDFNDLAQKSSLGKGAVKRQLQPIINKICMKPPLHQKLKQTVKI